MTKLLLDHGADVAAADNLGSHETVAKLLLDHGAGVAARNSDDVFVLMTDRYLFGYICLSHFW